MEWKDQPIVIVYESRFDFILHAVGLAAELRLDVTDLDWPTVFVLSFIRDLAALGFPFPLVSKFEDSGNFSIPRVTNRFNLSIRIETVCLGDLFENWRALLRPGS